MSAASSDPVLQFDGAHFSNPPQHVASAANRKQLPHQGGRGRERPGVQTTEGKYQEDDEERQLTRKARAASHQLPFTKVPPSGEWHEQKTRQAFCGVIASSLAPVLFLYVSAVASACHVSQQSYGISQVSGLLSAVGFAGTFLTDEATKYLKTPKLYQAAAVGTPPSPPQCLKRRRKTRKGVLPFKP